MSWTWSAVTVCLLGYACCFRVDCSVRALQVDCCGTGVWKLWLGETHCSVPLKVHPLPFSLLSSFHASFFSLHPFSSLPSLALSFHSLSGRAMPEGPLQRVVAAAEACSTGSFHSESGFHFWGPGSGQGCSHTDRQLAGFGEELPWAGDCF